MVDALIVGGGIAGSSLAMLLGRQGLRCELYEQGRFPKEKPCGEGLMPGGVAVLERLGLGGAVGGVAFRGVRYHVRGNVVAGPFPGRNGKAARGRGQRRVVLDHVLFEAAKNAPGVTAHCGVRVEGPLIEGSRVVGVTVGGEARRGRLVVGADGAHSRMRRALQLDVAVARKRVGARAHYRLPNAADVGDWVDVYVSRGYEFYVTPLPNSELLVALLADARFIDGSIEAAFTRRLRREARLAARLDGAEQVSELITTSPLAGRALAGIVPGAVLLGDAAGFQDPITGGGMTQALMTAELLAASARQGLAHADAWLPEFDRGRYALLRDYQMLTRTVLWLASHPGMGERLLSLLRLAPPLLSHLVAVSAGTRSLSGAPLPVAGATPA